MAKYPYFESLEALSDLVSQAVCISCTDAYKKERETMSALRLARDKTVCEIEDALFADFLPPLERDSIAASAHALSRVIDRASDLAQSKMHFSLSLPNEEARICMLLAEQLAKDFSLLRTIRKPSEMPSLREFRSLLSEARAAHGTMLSRVASGAFPRYAAETVLLCGRLRSELSCAFDELVEIMLNNI